MSANYTGIEQTIFNAVLTVDNTTPKSWPNSELKDSDKPDGLWLAVYNLRAVSNVATLGSAGEDNHPGILQIDLNFPVEKGTKTVLNKADEFTAYFTAGKKLSYNGQRVVIISSSVGSGRIVGRYYRVSISINYYARTTRS